MTGFSFVEWTAFLLGGGAMLKPDWFLPRGGQSKKHTPCLSR